MLQNLDVIEQKSTVLTMILYYRYYDTKDFYSISIIVTLNITIYDNIVILLSPIGVYKFVLSNLISHNGLKDNNL